MSFSAAGRDPDGGAVTYAWAFEDGTALGAQVTRTLHEPGTHTATVTVTDDEGDTASDTVSVTVADPANTAPVIREAIADRTTGPAPLGVWFQAVADDAEGGTLTYRWEFGDGPGSALGAEAEHTYLEPGTFTAKVTVTDRGGLSDSDDDRDHGRRPAGQPGRRRSRRRPCRPPARRRSTWCSPRRARTRTGTRSATRGTSATARPWPRAGARGTRTRGRARSRRR